MKLQLILGIMATMLAFQVLGNGTEAKVRKVYPYISFKHDYRVGQLLFTPDGSEILSESVKDGLKITETATGRFARTLVFNGYSVNSMTLSSDGARFAVGTNTGKVELWNMQPPQLQKTFPVTKWSIYAVALSPDGRMLGSCAADGTIQLWDIESSRILYTLGKKDSRMISMSFSGDNEWIAVLCRTGRADVWDTATGQLVGKIDIPQASGIGSIAFCPDSRSVVVTATDGIRFWNLQEKEGIRKIGLPDSIDPDKIVMEKLKNKLAWSASGPVYMPITTISLDCKRAASVIEDGTIVVWDVETRAIQQKLIGSRIPDHAGGGIEQVAFSADKKLLTSGNWDGTVEVYRLFDDIGFNSGGEIEAGWGEVVEGLQCRLRSDRQVYKLREIPVFELDLRNNGQKDIDYFPIAGVHCGIEWDGQWYVSREPVIWDGPNYILKAGEEARKAIVIDLAKKWLSKDDSMPLNITPGKHTIRVRFVPEFMGMKSYLSGGERLSVVSNPFDIEILPTEAPSVKLEEQDEWGEAVEGVQIGIIEAGQVWGRSDWPYPVVRLKLAARNDGQLPQRLPGNGLMWQIEVNGEWYKWTVPRTLTSYTTNDLEFNTDDSYSDLKMEVAGYWKKIPKGKEADFIPIIIGGNRGVSDAELGEELVFEEGQTYRIRTAIPCQHIRPGRWEVIRLISNPVEITIQPFENSSQQAEQAIHWGEQVDSLQLGLYFDLDRDYFYQGERVGFNLYARNTGDKTLNLVHYVNAPPIIHNSQGQRKRVFVPLRDGFQIQPNYLTVEPGQIKQVRQIGFTLARKAGGSYIHYFNPEPDTYSVQQQFRFIENEQANWHGELTTGTLTMKILPPKGPTDLTAEDLYANYNNTEAVKWPVDTSDEKIRQFYEENRGKLFTRHRRIWVRTIVTPDEKTAQQACRRARAGEDFDELIAEYFVPYFAKHSEDRYVEKRVEAFVSKPEQFWCGDLLVKMNPGDISDPVLRFGEGPEWAVLKVVSITEGHVAELDDVRDNIYQILWLKAADRTMYKEVNMGNNPWCGTCRRKYDINGQFWHLAQKYDKEGQTDKAVGACLLALTESVDLKKMKQYENGLYPEEQYLVDHGLDMGCFYAGCFSEYPCLNSLANGPYGRLGKVGDKRGIDLLLKLANSGDYKAASVLASKKDRRVIPALKELLKDRRIHITERHQGDKVSFYASYYVREHAKRAMELLGENADGVKVVIGTVVTKNKKENTKG